MLGYSFLPIGISRKIMKKISQSHKRFVRLCLKYAEIPIVGRFASRLATIGFAPFHGQVVLADFSPKGFVASGAKVHHPNLITGKHVFIGDGVFIYRDVDGGTVELANHVKIIGNSFIQTGFGGSCHISSGTSIQPNCQLSAYKASIYIGRNVEIAPFCAFYPYDHGTILGRPIHSQPLNTKGGITVDDEAWLGIGVTVLDGVHIGKGTVVGAGSVVNKDLPDNSIAAGVPARVLKMREKSFNKDCDLEKMEINK